MKSKPSVPEPQASTGRSRRASLGGIAVASLAVIALIVWVARGTTTPSAESTAPTASPAQVVENAAAPPAPGALPPLPLAAFTTGVASAEDIQSVYAFAARHPEVLDYVPCFCGCEQAGHRGNTDCFVASRDAAGQVRWDLHGAG